jgi:anthranilate phosphoribosyltransferase
MLLLGKRKLDRRSLQKAKSHATMTLILRNEFHIEQLGALLMLSRVKE